MEKIVVSGGSGLVGQALIPVLKRAGYNATSLPRPYLPDSLKGATTIINLAGENLSAGRWTAERKRRIIDSRVNSLNTIREILKKDPNQVHTLISASAVGFYGTTTSNHLYTEDEPAGTDFLAEVSRQWESAADSFKTLNIRVVKVRIGVVFSPDGGALPKMMMPLKFGISTPLGTGNQWIPWIDINDLTGIFLHLVQNKELSGAFNAVSPNPVTNRDLMKQLAVQKHKLFIPIGIPAILLKALLGEMSVITLAGSRISSDKLINSGYLFQSPHLQNALKLP